MNKDFYEELPGMVCAILDDLIEKYGDKQWFNQAWEDKIFENTLTEDNFTLALWRSRLITYEKVLNKIEKSDKQ